MKVSKVLLMLTVLFMIQSMTQAQEIFDAIKANDLAKVRALIEQDPQVKDRMDIRNLSPLHHALTSKNPDMIRLLIDCKVDVNVAGNLGRTPLLWALSVAQSSLEIVSALIDAGAQIESKDTFGYTPLVYAAQQGNAEIVSILLSKNAEVSIEPPNGVRLLFACAQNGLKDLMNRMIEKGADIKMNGLLHSAASNGQDEIINMLMEQKIDVNQRSNGWTPLHFASYYGHCTTIQKLLSLGADLNVRTEGMGQSASNLAVENEKKEAAELLEKIGLKLSPPEFPRLEDEYLGQKKPGRTAEIFAQGIVNVPMTLHSSISFSPDGKEAYWSFAFDNNKTMVSRLENGVWTYPVQAVFEGIPVEDIPTFHPDGHWFYDLARKRLYPDGTKREKEDIWIWERDGRELKNPRPLPEEVNFARHHWQFTVDRRGNVYFQNTLPGTEGGSDIWVCRFEGGAYQKHENLGKKINSPDGEGFPYVDPDCRYILFVRKMDVYVSFRDPQGGWTEAKPLGPEVNTPGIEILPTVSPDGKCLFFKRNQTIYWIDAGVIEEMRKDSL